MKKISKKKNISVMIFSVITVYLVALVGTLVMGGATDSEWYDNIRPDITPPNIVFPIVWNILFLLIAISLYVVWTRANKNEKKKVAWVFGINFVLNILWSYLFFGQQNVTGAFYELIVLWISIVSMIYVSYKIDKKAGWLLVPYLLWVSFAGYLNWLMAFA